jgi:hypothetical protein
MAQREYCSFDAIIGRYGLDKDPALVELGKIVRAADTPRKDWAPEGIGLEAIATLLFAPHFFLSLFQVHASIVERDRAV